VTSDDPHALPSTRRSARPSGPLAVVVALGLAVGLAACGGTPPAETGPNGGAPASPSSVTSASAPAEPDAEPDAEDEPADAGTPEAAFHAWLVASRAPDVDAACAAMADELVARLVDQLASHGMPGVTDCPSLITTTAQAYQAAGSEPTADVSVREERSDATVLFVTYPGGKCGTVVMEPRASGWVMTEQSEQEC